ncbi:Cullin binding-domain-containing protein [Phakopsora pachyrhizi]|nr:Cullin binding-domain-containing protein [Phakopsora pachyrhizi]
MTKSQKEATMAEFRSLTNAIPADASRICKKAGYKLNLAFELFYNDNLAQSNAERSLKSRSKVLSEGFENLLKAQFDQFQDPDDPNRMEMDGLMRYLTTLNLTPEDPKVICLCHLLKSPRLGIIIRTEFLNNWLAHFLSQQPTRTLQSNSELVGFQIDAINGLDRRLRSEASYFQNVYRFIFDFGRDEGQKSLALETAIAFWELILHITPNLDSNVFKPVYLKWWFELLQQRNKSVTRDTWNLFLDFILQLDDRFENYDESAAWPSLIDDYVALAKNKLNEDDMDLS